MNNYYEFMGLSINSSHDEIKKTFRTLSKKYHPDFGGNPKDFQLLCESYEILGDTKTREEYNKQILLSEFNMSQVSVKKNNTFINKSAELAKKYFKSNIFYLSALIPLTITFLIKLCQIIRTWTNLNLGISLFIFILSLSMSKITINLMYNYISKITNFKFTYAILAVIFLGVSIFQSVPQFLGSILYVSIGIYLYDSISSFLIRLLNKIKKIKV